jgi:hypothetical protein
MERGEEDGKTKEEQNKNTRRGGLGCAAHIRLKRN